MTTQAYRGNAVAIILPCYNEAPAIAQVVADFRAALPEASIHVFDNASSDGTADVARAVASLQDERQTRHFWFRGHTVPPANVVLAVSRRISPHSAARSAARARA